MFLQNHSPSSILNTRHSTDNQNIVCTLLELSMVKGNVYLQMNYDFGNLQPPKAFLARLNNVQEELLYYPPHQR